MNGKLKDWSFSRTGESVLTITTRESCKKLWDALGDQEITFSIKRRVIPRSLNANNYAWSLIEKLAVAVKSDKDSVYEEMLFPKDSAAAGRWFSIVQHRAQREYFKAHELDVIILGRRRADGNYVGRNSNIYTDGKGVTRFSPLAAWKHEHILAYIHYHQLPLPPIYGWKNGYLCGTHPWPARQWTGSIENGWREVYDIDPSIVLAAAEKIDSARAFLKGVQA